MPPPLSLCVHLPCVQVPVLRLQLTRRGPLPFEAYVDALLAASTDLPLARGRTVHSVFFSGGASLFPPAQIDRFLQGASARLRSRRG